MRIASAHVRRATRQRSRHSVTIDEGEFSHKDMVTKFGDGNPIDSMIKYLDDGAQQVVSEGEEAEDPASQSELMPPQSFL